MLPKYAWPGGYPIFYVTEDNALLCPDCANGKNGSLASKDSDDKQWRIVGSDINYEDDMMFCEHCSKKIESAYGE